MMNMKYLGMNWEKFQNGYSAFIISFMQQAIVFSIEMMNIIIMTTIDSWEDLIFDFLALSCLAEFDDLFLTVFG